MRVFGIEPDGKFKEYVQTPFQVQHEEAILESWLEGNPDGIVEDGKLLIIGRQVSTNLGSVIDLLALDRRGDVVVVELKRDRTPRDTLAQALEYVSFVVQLDTEQLEAILRSYLNDDSLSLQSITGSTSNSPPTRPWPSIRISGSSLWVKR
jgi:RecB family endonuclease NucS